jgi:hypothetical protein
MPDHSDEALMYAGALSWSCGEVLSTREPCILTTEDDLLGCLLRNLAQFLWHMVIALHSCPPQGWASPSSCLCSISQYDYGSLLPGLSSHCYTRALQRAATQSKPGTRSHLNFIVIFSFPS